MQFYTFGESDTAGRLCFALQIFALKSNNANINRNECSSVTEQYIGHFMKIKIYTSKLAGTRGPSLTKVDKTYDFSRTEPICYFIF